MAICVEAHKAVMVLNSKVAQHNPVAVCTRVLCHALSKMLQLWRAITKQLMRFTLDHSLLPASSPYSQLSVTASNSITFNQSKQETEQATCTKPHAHQQQQQSEQSLIKGLRLQHGAEGWQVMQVWLSAEVPTLIAVRCACW